MASISDDPNGRRRILFTGADGKRRAIRLGRVQRRYAESVKVKIEDLVGASIHSHAPRDDTSQWLVTLDSSLYDKLAKAGLVKPRGKALLGEFTRAYIDGRSDIKEQTRINLERVRDYLLEYFDADQSMRDITPGDAEDFRQHLIRSGRGDNTVRRAIGRARQFFKAAQRRHLIQSNPFEGIAASVRANQSRFHFVSREDAAKVLEHCPDAQWRLIFALARYGGLRCPSEVLALRWEDIDWQGERICVPSPKTEHIDGKAFRTIPMFRELKPILLEAFDEAEPGDEYVITRYRSNRSNLRTQLRRIIKRAGLVPWEKPFQNLRSTRETELAEYLPIHAVCHWVGNSQPVAAEHYLQVTDEHFERALRGDAEAPDAQAAQNAAQKAQRSGRTETNDRSEVELQAVEDSRDSAPVGVGSARFVNQKAPPRGLEPLLPG